MLRGEVDWIVMKALEKDRTRRYETASGLARDVQRDLADEMVEARPQSTGYRLRKFVRRNKGPVVAASVLLLTLLLGIAGTTFGLIQAGAAWRSEQARAEGEATAKRDANEQRDAAVRRCRRAIGQGAGATAAVTDREGCRIVRRTGERT